MRYILFILGLLFILPSCQKKDNTFTEVTTVDSMRIQQYGGMMPRHRVYNITPDRLSQDTSFRSGDTVNYIFNVELGQDKLDLVLYLLHEVPKQLLEENNILIGDPQSQVDGTATYVFIYKDGVKHTYLVATDVSTLPSYMKVFGADVQQAFTDLQ